MAGSPPITYPIGAVTQHAMTHPVPDGWEEVTESLVANLDWFTMLWDVDKLREQGIRLVRRVA